MIYTAKLANGKTFRIFPPISVKDTQTCLTWINTTKDKFVRSGSKLINISHISWVEIEPERTKYDEEIISN